ncbi:MAG: signal peptidase I [Candidatus Hydrogenedens sp.]
MVKTNQSFNDNSPLSPEENYTPRIKKNNLFKNIVQAITGPWTKRNLIEWIVIIGSILFIKGCLIDQYIIPSGSMEPTLHGGNLFTGDRVLVNKFIYGLRIPFTTIRILTWSKPKRWDIVVFKCVSKESEHSTLIKRVVGLPGEKIRIRNGRILVNGEVIPFPPSMPPNIYYLNDEDLLYQYRTNPDPRAKKIIEEMWKKYPYRYGCLDEESFSVIPEGHYFFLGDNSINSVDSRIYGWVPENHIIGRAFAIWWPPNRWRDFTGFSSTLWGKILLYIIPTLLTFFLIVYIFTNKKRSIT